MANVTREGRIRFELVDGEVLFCGKCSRAIEGTPDEADIAFITVDGLDSQDHIVLCFPCLDELAGPEFEATP